MKFPFLLTLLTFTTSLFSQSKIASQYFKKYEVIEMDANALLSQVRGASNGYSFTLDNWQLEMEVVDLFTRNYRSVDENGIEVIGEGGRPVPLKGFTTIGGEASITIAKDFVFGFIEDKGRTFYIEPYSYYAKDSKKNQFILYDSRDVIEGEERTCGFTETERAREERLNNVDRSTGLCYDIEYAICNDYSMFTKHGSIPQVEAHVTGITNNVNMNYDDEFADELRFVISGIYTISTSGADPWTSSTDPSVLLPDFRTWCVANLASSPINISHDVASLWTDRNFNGSTVGLAYNPGVCQSNSKYNVLQNYTSDANSLRVLTAHELGHNLSSGHDNGTSTYIMSPVVNNTTVWTGASISTIDSYVNGVSCLTICAGSTPQVNFDEYNSVSGESNISGTAGPCLEPYVEVMKTVSLSSAPSSSVVIGISVDAGSTASANYDYELMTTSLTFTPAGALTQDVNVRIYDDKIEEVDETIVLNLSVTSGTANMGPLNQHTLTVSSLGDEVSSTCCSEGAQQTYGTFSLLFPAIFRGEAENSKSRILLEAADLTALGLTAGFIDQLSLYVYFKGSTGAFENFRIGMKEVSDTEISGAPWYDTDEVFFGDVTTVVSSWNDFDFTNLFLWDGVSNIYVDFCFNNTSTVGQDQIVGFNVGTAGVESLTFRTSNVTAGCDLNTGGYTYYIDIHPHLKLRQLSGASVATVLNTTSSGRLQSGDIAHFYSVNNKIVASIKNTGSVDMECVDVTIHTAGANKSNLPYGTFQYSNKTFHVDADNEASYELTLYYTNAELSIWGAENLNLNFVKSTVPIASSSESNSEFFNTSEVLTGVGSGTNISYKTNVQGSGYYALTDGEVVSVYGQVANGDFAINSFGNGILIKNTLGDQYLLNVDLLGSLTTTLNNAATPNAKLFNGDLIINTNGKGIVFNMNDILYTKVNVDNDGNLISTIIGSIPSSNITLSTGNFLINEDGAGIVFKNAQSECWRLFIDATGVVVTTQITCP